MILAHQHAKYDKSVDLTGFTIAAASLEVEGEIRIRGVCTLETSQLSAAHFEIQAPLTASRCRFVSRLGFMARDSVTAPGCEIEGGNVTLLGGGTIGSITAEEVRSFGTLRADSIVADRIHIDGDLIVDGVCTAKSVDAVRGQVFAPQLTAGVVRAAILANYTDERLPSHYEFGWSRPIPPEYHPGDASLAKTKHSSYLMLQHFCGHIEGMYELLNELMLANDCQSFDLYFTRLFPFLREHYSELKPAAQEMLECFELGGFPSEFWRF